MELLKKLEPVSVWNYFEEICQIPRPSKKEEKIIQYLLDFAKKHQLEYKKDKAGNILIKKQGNHGMEKVKPVILQSHMDMVCEKNSNTDHDFEKDPIQPYIDGDWVKAKGTTLGADDGIGMAAQLAILSSPASELRHGPIECLFTVDEETGLTGAFELEPGFFSSRTLINLDSEDEGEIFIGCAGGIDTYAYLDVKKESCPTGYTFCKISVSGLKGGHSGDDIDKGRGNANKILNRFLWFSSEKMNIRLSLVDGGNLKNAIPREAYAVISIPDTKLKEFNEWFEKYVVQVKKELAVNEPGLSVILEKTEMPNYVMDIKSQKTLLNALYACPHGVISMSADMENLVETSTNLASVKFKDNETVVITTSQRSSKDSAKLDIAQMVQSVFDLAGARSERSRGYPGWAPDTASEILHLANESYKKLFGCSPKLRAIHAGLECGLFLEKYPGLDMISIGPTLRGVHSPDEKMNIQSVQKFWDFLVEILRVIPEKK